MNSNKEKFYFIWKSNADLNHNDLHHIIFCIVNKDRSYFNCVDSLWDPIDNYIIFDSNTPIEDIEKELKSFIDLREIIS
jgi:hypothetical protein